MKCHYVDLQQEFARFLSIYLAYEEKMIFAFLQHRNNFHAPNLDLKSSYTKKKYVYVKGSHRGWTATGPLQIVRSW